MLTRRHELAPIVLALVPVAGGAAQTEPGGGGGPQPAPNCTGSLVPKAWEKIIDSTPHRIGPDGTSQAFQLSNLAVPEPIELSIVPIDVDRLYVSCTEKCYPDNAAAATCLGIWQVDWTIESGNGKLLTVTGQLTSAVTNQDTVLLVPPRDLDCGSTDTTRVLATVRDVATNALFTLGGTSIAPGDSLQDANRTATFEVVTSRLAPESDPGGAWGTWFNVTVTPLAASQGQTYPGDCVATPNDPPCCPMQGATPNAGSAITVDSFSVPSDGILTKTKRIVTAHAIDIDSIAFSCGQIHPCPDVQYGPQVPQAVQYAWTIVSGPGTLTYADRQSAVLEAGDTPGDIHLRLTVSNPGQGLASAVHSPDTPNTDYEWHIPVYKLQVIDGSNTPISTELSSAGGTNNNACLEVSQVVTGADMNGSKGSLGAPTFDGPLSSDPRVYRIQLDATGAPTSTGAFKTRLLRQALSQPHGPGTYDEDFAEPTDMMKQGSIYRTLPHLRFVGLGEPNPAINTSGIYDDEVGANQTIYVGLGDWMGIEILKGSAFIGRLDLPVARPWSEIGRPQSVRTATLHWFRAEGWTPCSSAPFGYESSIDFETWKANGYFAQANLKLVRSAGAAPERRLAKNALFILDTTMVTADTTVSFDVQHSRPGQPAFPVDHIPAFTIPANTRAKDIAALVAAAINNVVAPGGGSPPPAFKYKLDSNIPTADKGWLVSVWQDDDATFTNLSWAPPLAGGEDLLRVPVLAYGISSYTAHELHVLAFNARIDIWGILLGSHVPPIDCILTATAIIGPEYIEPGGGNALGRAWRSIHPTSFLSQSSATAMCAIFSKYVDGCDIDPGGGFPNVVAHEIGHLFNLQHTSSTELIMNTGGPDGVDPAIGTRFMSSEVATMRTDGRTWLERPCVPIPTRQ